MLEGFSIVVWFRYGMYILEYWYILIIDKLMGLVGYEYEECIMMAYFTIPSMI